MMWDGRAVNPRNPSKPGMKCPEIAGSIRGGGIPTPTPVAPVTVQPKTMTPTTTMTPQTAKTAVQLAIDSLSGKTGYPGLPQLPSPMNYRGMASGIRPTEWAVHSWAGSCRYCDQESRWYATL